MLRTKFILCLVLAGTLRAVPATVIEPEDELKAAIVLNFLRFAEWPHPAAGSSITVGVYGRPSFAQTLRRTLEGKALNSRPLRVVDVNSAADAPSYDVLYFAAGQSSDIKQMLAGPSVTHALTIGQSKDFLDLGGAVNLMVVDGRMSFEFSLDALNRAGWTVSSKLLRFGLIRGRRKGETS